MTSTVVTFSDAASAEASLVLDNASVNGKVVSVRLVRAARAPAAAAAAPAASAKAPKAAGARAPRAPPAARAAAAPAAARRGSAVAGAVLPDTVAVLGLRNVPPEEIAEHFASAGEIDSIRFVFRGYVAARSACAVFSCAVCNVANAPRSDAPVYSLL